MRLAAAIGAAAVVMAAAGCSSGQPGDITVAGEKLLAPKVQQVRDVAATGTYAQLVRVVNQLKRLVDTEVNDGQVSQSRANAIKDAADTLLTDARPAESPSPSTSPTPSHTSASPTPSASPSASSSASPSPSSSGSSSPGTSITIGGSPP
jgi:hypothetical protein